MPACSSRLARRAAIRTQASHDSLFARVPFFAVVVQGEHDGSGDGVTRATARVALPAAAAKPCGSQYGRIKAAHAVLAATIGHRHISAALAGNVSVALSAGAPMCPCGNGRTPVTAYRYACEAFAAAIRRENGDE